MWAQSISDKLAILTLAIKMTKKISLFFISSYLSLFLLLFLSPFFVPTLLSPYFTVLYLVLLQIVHITFVQFFPIVLTFFFKFWFVRLLALRPLLAYCASLG
jgi:hypothetical protein